MSESFKFVMRLRSVFELCAVRAVRAVCADLKVTPGQPIQSANPGANLRCPVQKQCSTNSPMKIANNLHPYKTTLNWNSPSDKLGKIPMKSHQLLSSLLRWCPHSCDYVALGHVRLADSGNTCPRAPLRGICTVRQLITYKRL